MMSRLLRSQSNPGLRYAMLIALLVGLLAGGYLIGSGLNAIFQAPVSSASAGDTHPPAGAVVNPPRRVQDFTLTSKSGAAISLSDLRGKALLMFFGYTHCPDVCPTTLADFKRVKQALGDAAQQVNFAFISVDGLRDTPPVLTSFLDQFDSDFVGMTGDPAKLRQVGAEYGLAFEQDAAPAEDAHADDAGPGAGPGQLFRPAYLAVFPDRPERLLAYRFLLRHAARGHRQWYPAAAAVNEAQILPTGCSRCAR